MQAQPILDQFDDDLVRDQSAVLEHFGSLLPQRRPEIAFTAQNRAGEVTGIPNCRVIISA